MEVLKGGQELQNGTEVKAFCKVSIENVGYKFKDFMVIGYNKNAVPVVAMNASALQMVIAKAIIDDTVIQMYNDMSEEDKVKLDELADEFIAELRG